MLFNTHSVVTTLENPSKAAATASRASRASRASTSTSSSSASHSTYPPRPWKKLDAHIASSVSSTAAQVPPAQDIRPPPDAHISTPPVTATLHRRDDMLAQFFGGSGRHSDEVTLAEPPSHTRSFSSRTDVESLPPYESQVAALPPRSVARYLFIYGFLFPPIWLFGASFLLIPLRAPPQWSYTKSIEEQTRVLDDMRMEDVKWAKRCLLAFITMLAFIVIIVFSVVRFH